MTWQGGNPRRQTVRGSTAARAPQIVFALAPTIRGDATRRRQLLKRAALAPLLLFRSVATSQPESLVAVQAYLAPGVCGASTNSAPQCIAQREPAGGLRFAIRLNDERRFEFTTRADGTFNGRLTPGSYVVELATASHHLMMPSIVWHVTLAGPNELTLMVTALRP